MTAEIILYSVIFVLVGLMFLSFFLVWRWYDAGDRVKVVREVTREQTIQAIHRSHNKCRKLLYCGLALAIIYIPLPFILGDGYSTLAYPGVVILADVLILIALRMNSKKYLDSIDDKVAENEEHVREAAAARELERQQWKQEAKYKNPEAMAIIKKYLGENYETWFKHDILVSRCVLANREEGLLYAQGLIIPFKEIREVRQGRKDLKLVTSNSLAPFITIDFGTLSINPETGNKYKDEIAAKLEEILP